MVKRIRKSEQLPEERPTTLGELIHAQVRAAIETAVYEELALALGAGRYERHGDRRGYRNGVKTRTLTGPTGPLALTLPRATMGGPGGGPEWTSSIVPRYQRRLGEINEAVIAPYLAGGNPRRIRGALHPLLKAAPLSKSAGSRIVAPLKDGLTTGTQRPLTDVDLVYLYRDAVGVRVRRAGQVTSAPVVTAVGGLADGRQELLALELCGSESADAGKGFVEDVKARGLRAPLLAVIDGHPGLRHALGRTGPTTAGQRGAVHKLRNLERKAPQPLVSPKPGRRTPRSHPCYGEPSTRTPEGRPSNFHIKRDATSRSKLRERPAVVRRRLPDDHWPCASCQCNWSEKLLVVFRLNKFSIAQRRGVR